MATGKGQIGRFSKISFNFFSAADVVRAVADPGRVIVDRTAVQMDGDQHFRVIRFQSLPNVGSGFMIAFFPAARCLRCLVRKILKPDLNPRSTLRSD